MNSGSMLIIICDLALSFSVFCLSGIILSSSTLDLDAQVLFALFLSVIFGIMFFIFVDCRLQKEVKKS